jgi:predicted 2-oxoglutarate/Fe(II)-dependent dioxygenase YbiX
MPNADFFSMMGFFVARSFVDSDTCARLLADVRAAQQAPATVRVDGTKYEVDRDTRSTDMATVSPEGLALVEGLLADVAPRVAAHYGTEISGWQKPQFLVYREGDFFRPHRDRAEDEHEESFSQARRVSAVLFLNGDGDPEAEGFRGGALTFYGLFDKGDETLGFPLESEEGLLVTFPTDVVHEVRAVEAGERYTVVTWFVDEAA